MIPLKFDALSGLVRGGAARPVGAFLFHISWICEVLHCCPRLFQDPAKVTLLWKLSPKWSRNCILHLRSFSDSRIPIPRTSHTCSSFESGVLGFWARWGDNWHSLPSSKYDNNCAVKRYQYQNVQHFPTIPTWKFARARSIFSLRTFDFKIAIIYETPCRLTRCTQVVWCIRVRFSWKIAGTQWRTQHTGMQGKSCTFGFEAPIQYAKCGGMTTFDENVNHTRPTRATETLLRNSACKKSAVSASCQVVAPTYHQISMRLSVQCHAPTFDNSWVRHCRNLLTSKRTARCHVNQQLNG